MFRIAICDDKPVICSQIEKIVLDYGRKAFYDIEADVYFSGEELYRYLEDGTYFDLIFLDIELRELNGINVGSKIRNDLKNESIQIVYISGKDNYALDLFEVRPMHFLVKPVGAEMILSVLEKGMELSNKLGQTFQYKQGHTSRKIVVKNIIYFESLDRKVRMITTEGEEIFYGSLTDIFSQLERYGFFFCHKSYLVNYHHIIKFEYEKLMMKNGMNLPISQPKRKSIRALQMRREMGEV